MNFSSEMTLVGELERPTPVPGVLTKLEHPDVYCEEKPEDGKQEKQFALHLSYPLQGFLRNEF